MILMSTPEGLDILPVSLPGVVEQLPEEDNQVPYVSLLEQLVPTIQSFQFINRNSIN